jgi:hypothetical protein
MPPASYAIEASFLSIHLHFVICGSLTDHHSGIGDISFLAKTISGMTPTSVPGGRNSDT